MKSFFQKITLLVSILFPVSLVASTWSAKETKMGCEYQYDNYTKFKDYTKSISTLKIIKDLPFPWLEYKTTDDSINITKLHLFCSRSCSGRDDEFTKDFRRVFPLEVNKKITIEIPNKSMHKLGIAKIVIKVLKERKSPYLENSSEYLVETSIGKYSMIDDEPYYVTMRRFWWNTKLDFMTERITPYYRYRIKSASCLTDDSLIPYKEIKE